MFIFMGNFDDKANDKFSHLKEGEVILIENIRYFKEETDNNENFSKKLASLGDIYINNAFFAVIGNSHLFIKLLNLLIKALLVLS